MYMFTKIKDFEKGIKWDFPKLQNLLQREITQFHIFSFWKFSFSPFQYKGGKIMNVGVAQLHVHEKKILCLGTIFQY